MTEALLLILAAGRSSRFGADKRLARLPDGRSLLQCSRELAVAASLDYRVVLDPDAEIGLEAAQVLRAPRAAQGMGCSIADAVAQLPDGFRAVLILPADLPLLRAETVAAVAAAATEDTIVVPVADGRRGHPVAFGRRFRPMLAALGGDTGGRDILRSHPEAVVELEVGDAGCYRDVDTPAELEALLGEMGECSSRR